MNDTVSRQQLQEQIVKDLIGLFVNFYNIEDSSEFNPAYIHSNQQIVSTEGTIQAGSNLGDPLVVYQQDWENSHFINTEAFNNFVECHKHPNQSGYYEFNPGTIQIINIPPVHISFNKADCDIGSIQLTEDDKSILKVIGQLFKANQTSTSIDTEQANLILDTEIFELMPRQGLTRQQEIDNFFQAFNNLINPSIPTFTEQNYWDSENADYPTSASYDEMSVSDLGPVTGFITRVESEADTDNEGKTLEELHIRTGEYLKDLYADSLQSMELPDYEEKSSGYLKMRNLNQAIIIRNQEGKDIGLENWETDGFTITQWVRFKDKVNGGTLFNYGNPFRTNNPQGFSLDTFISSGEKRYVRLTVRETLDISGDDRTIDSHVGTSGHNKVNLSTATPDDSQYTEIPVDLNEWYFIVATYDTSFNQSTPTADNQNLPLYWTGNLLEDLETQTHHSGLGNKCKVEIISKTDLLRARGYNV